jgi:hypothetical protein
MPRPRTTPSHRAKGSWTPRLAGVAVVVVLAGGVLAIYLATARQQSPSPSSDPSPHPEQTLKVVKVQTIGVIDFGPVEDGDFGQGNAASRALMLLPQGHKIDFVTIPHEDLILGKAVWTANQLSDNSDVFIYVASGKCLAGSPRGRLTLRHCNLAPDQRWRPLHQRVVQNQVIALYQNAATSKCLTAPEQPGLATTTSCGPADSKTQQIAFWWSA